MSRIPLPAASQRNRDKNTSPTPYSTPALHTPGGSSERSTSPLPSLQPRRLPSTALSAVNEMSTVSGFSLHSETRKKTTKKDEAIRKRIESELARKRIISSSQQRPQQSSRESRRGKPAATKGTVAALKPSPALTVPEYITVAEASQLCAAKRTDCVLVVDEEEGLSGIFTAKDLAYRVTAEGLDPHTTPVSAIMTRDPQIARDTSGTNETLQTMVARQFRHMPVCNEDGNVVGLLDITKVFHEALGRVERSSAASEQLFAAMAGVQNELAGVNSNPQTAMLLDYAEKLKERTALPDLTTIMDSRTNPATVGPKTTVRDVAKLMKERRTTAVCVMEPPTVGGGPARIAGIFTSKDIVLRVIAAGLDSSRCSVVRVMTPHPDTAPPTLTIHDALKKMHNGRYLNLPVVEDDGRLVAIIDVLKLTVAILEKMQIMDGDNSTAENEGGGGPMWGRFFDSLGQEDDDGSVMSGAQSQFPPTPHSMRILQSPQSEVHPNDSASVVDGDNNSILDNYASRKGISLPTGLGAGSIVDDGTYVFKFRTPSGRTHRFQSRHDDIQHLREIVAGKLAIDPFFTEHAQGAGEESPDPNDFHMSYTDEDGDSVLMSTDSDVTDAVKVARKANLERVVLVVQGGKAWTEGNKGEDKAKEVSAAAAKEILEVELAEAEADDSPALFADVPKVPKHPDDDDTIFGIPKDLLLPASIGVLAAVIIGVFTVSKLTAPSHY